MTDNKTPSQLGFSFWMFGIPFVLVGACMVLSPAWYFFRATSTTYALTDQRVIMDISGPFPRRTSVPLSQVPFVDIRASNDGPGTFSSKKPWRITGVAEA